MDTLRKTKAEIERLETWKAELEGYSSKLREADRLSNENNVLWDLASNPMSLWLGAAFFIVLIVVGLFGNTQGFADDPLEIGLLIVGGLWLLCLLIGYLRKLTIETKTPRAQAIKRSLPKTFIPFDSPQGNSNSIELTQENIHGEITRVAKRIAELKQELATQRATL